MSTGDKASDTAAVGLKWPEIGSFAAGSVASNLSWNMVAAFLIVYYTDVALLPVAAVGTLVFFTRIFDALFDPLVGIAVDRTRSRWGKARPYLLFTALPFAVMSVLVFTVPVEASTQVKLIYAYATFGVLGLLYGLLYVPYASLQPLMTGSRSEQLKLSGPRAMGTSIASIFVYSLAMPAVLFFGGGDRAKGYTWAAALFGAITALLYLITFLNCRERLGRDTAADRVPLKDAFANIFANPIWRIAMGFEFLLFIRLGFVVASMAFYARLVLDAAWAVSLLLPVMSVGILTGGALSTVYLKRFGIRRGALMILAFTIVCFAALGLARDNIWLVTPLLFLGVMGNGVQAAMLFSMISEAVEMQHQRHGTRNSGLLASTAAFNMKVGFAVGSASLAWALGAFGYDPKVATPGVENMLGWTFCGVPIAIALLQMLVISFYRYDAKPGVEAKAGAVPA